MATIALAMLPLLLRTIVEMQASAINFPCVGNSSNKVLTAMQINISGVEQVFQDSDGQSVQGFHSALFNSSDIFIGLFVQ